MFKKLKEKITEEVKSSPQRVQQLAKSLVGNSTDDNMFSIDEETAVNSFNSSSSPLPSTYNKSRRDSNSSFASDISFLPNYETPSNLYHLQSDLDVSASEVEDSSIGAGDTKQMLNAYRNVLAKYNKYRGRYTDLANHYSILERENAKTKAVLVETQDKALRRFAELKEQCQLEQDAKAHIEQVLQEDLNERQILIDTLNQKIQLLQESIPSSTDKETIVQEDLLKIRIKNQELEQKLQEISQTNDIKNSLNQRLFDLETQMQESQRDFENKILLREQEIKRLQTAHEEELQQTINENISLSNRIKELDKHYQNEINYFKAEIKANKMMSDEKSKDVEKTISSLEIKNTSLQNKLKDALTLQDKVDDLVSELKATKVIQAQTEENVKSLENTLKTKENQLKQQNSQLTDITNELSSLKTLEKQTNDQHKKDEEFIKIFCNLLDKVGIQKKENILENKSKLLIQIRNYLDHKEADLTNITATCNTLNEKITELLKINSEHKNALESSSEDHMRLTNEIKDLKTKLNAETSAKVEKGTLNTEVLNLQKICEDQKTALNNSEIERQKLIKKIESLQHLVHDSKSALTNITKEKDKLNTEVKQLHHSFENIESNLLNSVAEKEKLLREVSKYKKLYEEKENQFKIQLDEHNKLVGEIKLLQDQINSFKDNDEISKLNSIIECISTDLDNTVQERDQLIEEMKKLQNELENKDKLQQTQNLYSEQQSEFVKTSKKEIEKLNLYINELEISLDNITQERNGLIFDNQSMLSEINHLKQQHCDNQNELKAIMKLRDDLTNEISDLKTLLDNKQIQLVNMSEDKEILQINLQKQNKNFEDVATDRDLLKKDIELLKKDIELLKKSCMDEVSAKNNLEDTNNKLQIRYKEIEIVVENLLQEIQQLKSKTEINLEIDAKNKLLNEAEEEINKLIQLCNEKQLEISSLEEERHKLEQYLDEIQSKLEAKEHQNSRYNELQLKYSELNQQLQAKTQYLSRAEEEIENLNISFNNEKSNLSTLRNENNLLQETINQLQLLVNEKDNKLDVFLNEIENGKINNNKYLELEEELEQKTNLLIKSEEIIQEIKQKFAELESKNTNLLKELEISKSEILINQNITDNNATMKLKDFEDENNKLRKIYDETVGKLNNVEIECSRLVDDRETNVQFYQNEILKLQNKNERLESKLDETLITLNHCTELSSSSTEMQYLKNILYNYMMGKESIVLARVIAAVCKFDPLQTEAVLQKEQQKQTLFGRLQ